MKSLGPIAPLLLIETYLVKGCCWKYWRNGGDWGAWGLQPPNKRLQQNFMLFFSSAYMPQNTQNYSLKHVKCIIKSVFKIIIRHNLLHFGVQFFLASALRSHYLLSALCQES